ncbi:MAG TPA: complex I NDUFA9 subunit family protein [Burkholderiales bacterium]|nr:complex I NDUFA9 subunit family protein [Burkholderiales bacterium]
MEIDRVCVIGGSGFVGSHVVQLLSAQRYLARVPTRQRERAKHLILLPTVDVLEANVHDATELAGLVHGVDAVINMVGVLHDGRGERGFEQAHVALTRKVIAACETQGVRRLVHMSALGADVDGPSKYQRTKGAAEALVRAARLDWTIFRPSVVFGRGDRFLNLFATLQRLLPVIFLGSPNARFQPVYVEDVAAAFVRCLGERSSYGKAYNLCGPGVYTLRELVALVGAITGHPRRIVGLNDTLSYLQALAMESLPVKLLTRDNYYSMKVDNISGESFPFGIVPKAIEAVVPAYLSDNAPRARYRAYRDHAGRATER